MLKQRVAIRSRIENSQEEHLKKMFMTTNAAPDLKLSRVFWLMEKTPGAFSKWDMGKDLHKVFCDSITEDLTMGFPEYNDDKIYVEVRYLGGVTDNWARSATEALSLVAGGSTKSWQDFDVEVHSGWQLEMSEDLSQPQVEKVLFQSLANPLLQKVQVKRGGELKQANTFADFHDYWKVEVEHKPELNLFPLKTDVLQQLNQERGLALSDVEIQTVIAHFSSPQQMKAREPMGWAGFVTEVEIECLAQTWSEHCKHKIFAANVEYTEDEIKDVPRLGTQTIKSLYKSYIQAATKKLDDCGYLVSVFKDNAGIVDFDKNVNVCVKVETHNSPSALDPFGGAITGILGVNRDILGCGVGAKPIANMDVFCLSKKDLFPGTDHPQRPDLLKDPGVIFRGVHQGVEEGGNQSGIPTVNGAFHFASEFAAKPLIFVGSLGVMPKQVHGKNSELKEIRPGDKIVVAGGRLGKDGVHGATFSSLELNDKVASNVVQIGDSITQKRLLDFTLMARDKNLIQAITDNGAGGVSSSIGEMATLSNGARMDLSKHPVKYHGLEFWEMLVSESQERMSFAVVPEKLQQFLDLAAKMGVETSCLGEFTDSGLFEVNYGDKPLAKLELEFLHDGLSKMELKAHFQGPKTYKEYFRETPKKKAAPTSANIESVLKTILANPNVASREPLVRYYDHEVQGATRVKPYGGKSQQGANNSGVIDLSIHGGTENNGVAVSNGLCPQLSYYDTYLMAQRAVDESVRNLVATGADPDKMALVDNFCWPDPTPKKSNPDAEHKMAQLVRACAGLHDAALVYRAPLVSGKDSMKNDFIGKVKSGDTVKISVPPTLLMTAIGQVPDARKTVNGFFAKAGDAVYLLGQPTESLVASVFAQEFESISANPEYPNLIKNRDLYRLIFGAIQHDILSSCHDISEGGLMSALAECCFGNELGVDLDLRQLTWENLWSEMGSQFVVSVAADKVALFERYFDRCSMKLGQVTDKNEFKWNFNGDKHSVKVSDLQTIWSQGVLNVYNA